MLLAPQTHTTPQSPPPLRFLYARVLGIFHADVVYSGPGRRDYEPRRLDFLWVRWYQTINSDAYGWKSSSLEALDFPDITHEGSFGFVDPQDVLRGCHVVPGFHHGMRQPSNSLGLSGLAKDKDDWRRYYVGRYVSTHLSIQLL